MILPINEIAIPSEFSHYASVSTSIAKFDRLIYENTYLHLAKLLRKIDNIINKKTWRLFIWRPFIFVTESFVSLMLQIMSG